MSVTLPREEPLRVRPSAPHLGTVAEWLTEQRSRGGQVPSVARLLAQFRRSLWGPILWRTVGVGVLMLGLTVIGAYATVRGVSRDVALPDELSFTSDVRSAWLAAGHAARPAVLARTPRVQMEGEPVEALSAPGGGPSSPPPVTGSASAVPGREAPPSAQSGVTPEGRVILNLASTEELMRLPGIGEKRAQAIVQLRNRLKRFRRTSDLLRIKGIGPKSLQRMLPYLVLDPPELPAASAKAIPSPSPSG